MNELDILTVGGLIGAVILLFVVGLAIGPRRGDVESLFRSPSDLGWPHGVQEEDSIHFTVGAIHERPTSDDDAGWPTSDPELIELVDTSDAIRLERLR